MNPDPSCAQRPSRFLLSRIEGFTETLIFFMRHTRHKVTFLLQLDFWDWEMEELLYAVGNFAERQRSWRVSGHTAAAVLCSAGIILRNRARAGYSPALASSRVKAPYDELANLIDRWNNLIAECETLLDANRIRQTLKSGGKALPNLSKYRKTIPS